jgi:cholesterol oxidase
VATEIEKELFDAVVVGSGYGGAVVACRLAEAALKVCVLERGRAYPPGHFPRREEDEMIWNPDDAAWGPLELRRLGQVTAVAASGLGGGSLLGAGLMRRANEPEIANSGLPLLAENLESHYKRVERRLAVTPYPARAWPYSHTTKTRALARVAHEGEMRTVAAPLATAFASDGEPPNPGEPIAEARPNLHAQPRYTCRLVGECRSGCNYGAKNTLDYTYLTDAQHAGAVLHTGVEVKRIRRLESEYRIECLQPLADALSEGTASSFVPRPMIKEIRARRVVLAAGALGSTQLLLASRQSLLPASSPIGSAMSAELSANGVAIGCNQINGLGRLPWRTDESPARVDPMQGPATTIGLKVVDGDILVHDTGLPEEYRWSGRAAPERVVPRRGWRAIAGRTGHGGKGTEDGPRPLHVWTQSALPLTARGPVAVWGTAKLSRVGLEIDWRAADWDRASLWKALESVAGSLGAVLVRLDDERRSEQVLGGCPMASTPREGVVDPYGAVFGAPGLWVTDGAILPGPLGPHPALTIAALADRCSERILEDPT